MLTQVVPLAHDISAQLSVLNQRIDSMLGRIAPERRDILQVSSRMLTYSDVCSRILTYADVNGRMRKYAGVC
jgi:hypothetical protein